MTTLDSMTVASLSRRGAAVKSRPTYHSPSARGGTGVERISAASRKTGKPGKVGNFVFRDVAHVRAGDRTSSTPFAFDSPPPSPFHGR